jgi:hypothetical protein
MRPALFPLALALSGCSGCSGARAAAGAVGANANASVLAVSPEFREKLAALRAKGPGYVLRTWHKNADAGAARARCRPRIRRSLRPNSRPSAERRKTAPPHRGGI